MSEFISSLITSVKETFLTPFQQLKLFAVFFFFFPVPVCAITASGVPGGTLVSMNRFSTLCE
jgi:hypothetical protein